MWLPKSKATNNAPFHPIVFVGKTLTRAETWQSNLERETLGILHGLEKIPTLLFCPGGQHDNRPQTAGGDLQK